MNLCIQKLSKGRNEKTEDQKLIAVICLFEWLKYVHGTFEEFSVEISRGKYKL